MRGTRGVLSVLAVGLALAGGACGGGEDDGGGPASTGADGAGEVVPAPAGPAAGGIYRVGVEGSFPFTNGFDPTGEYLSEAWALYSNLLIRTLLGYRHVAGSAGNELIPDLAADLPEISADGLTWVFRLKDGIRFGPPVDREITSMDVRYAFERIGTPSLAAQYGFYYDVIEGMAAFRDGKATTIAGIDTPDEKTIAFRLKEPTGDFGYRLAMPAAGPIPEEVGRCFTKAGEYGRHLVATGPYMIRGSDEVKAGTCGALGPIAGFDPSASLELVRNPEYDPATDSPEARESLPDGFLLTVDSNAADIYAKIRAGELDGEWASPPPKVLREYSSTEELRDRLHVNPADAIAYIAMNLTQPPFDDVHVRRAVNLVMDKEGLQRAWGGPLNGEIATHVLPDTIIGGLLAGYDPYPSEGSTGDLEAAKAEMAESAYDADGDGVCDASACDAVLTISTPHETIRAMEPVVQQSLAAIGIDLTIRELEDPFSAIQTVRREIPFTIVTTWAKDFADASTFMVLFDGRSIVPTGNVNTSLVGLTPAVAKSVGAGGSVDGIPSVDDRIDACSRLLGTNRLSCWADLDRTLMEDVVPWVPYLDRTNIDVVGPAVTQYGFDQFPAQTAYAHVAVDPAEQAR